MTSQFEIVPGYRVKRVIGSGYAGTVFLTDSRFGEVALKLQGDWECRREFSRLISLRGIPGVPKIFDYIVHNVDLGDVADRLGCELNQLSRSKLFHNSGIAMEYVPGSIEFRMNDLLAHIDENGSVPKNGFTPQKLRKYGWQPEFFDRLEETVSRVHERKVLIPSDATIINKKGQPYLVDWFDYNPSGSVDGDLEKIQKVRDWLLG